MRRTHRTGEADPAEGEAAQRLQEAGLRRTRRRVLLLALLRRARQPLSHHEIHRAFGTQRADRVSIYRALEAFVEKGLVHRALVGGRTYLYESADRCADDHCHPHFTCRLCGQVECLIAVDVPVIRDIGAGYEVERQQVHVSGLCPACGGQEAAQ